MWESVFSQIHQMAPAHMEVPRQFFFRDPFLACRSGFAFHTHARGVNFMLAMHGISDNNRLCANAAKPSKIQKKFELSGETGLKP